jgi:hypothetical protein
MKQARLDPRRDIAQNTEITRGEISMRYTRRDFLRAATACLGGALLGTACARVEAPGSFAFATINDMHVTDDGKVGLARKAVQMINDDASIGFVAVLGDLTNEASRSEFEVAREVLTGLKAPWVAIPGNHDVDGKDKQNPYANFELLIGPRQWVWPFDGWMFIGIDTCYGGASEVAFPEDRMKWLRETVAGVPRRTPIALFTHHPLLYPSVEQFRGFRVKNTEAILELFAGHKLKLVASGHFHGNQVEQNEGVLLTTTACCAVQRDNFDGSKVKGFRRYEVEGEQIRHAFMPVEA